MERDERVSPGRRGVAHLEENQPLLVPSTSTHFFLFASTIVFISFAVGGLGPSGGYTTYAWLLMMDSRFSGLAANTTVMKMGTET